MNNRNFQEFMLEPYHIYIERNSATGYWRLYCDGTAMEGHCSTKREAQKWAREYTAGARESLEERGLK